MQQALVLLKEFIENNSFVLFYLLAMLVCVFRLSELAKERARKLIWYSMAAGLAVLCPISAKLLMIYQTGFYSHPWIWSFVPVSAVSAWFLCELIFRAKAKQRILWILLLVVLLVYGKQGMLSKVEGTEEAWESQTRSLLKEIGEENFKEGLLWAPKEVMEYSRKASGEIRVLYGRSLWEAEAAAYDYEIYLNDLVEIYEWMENLGKEELDLVQSKEILQNALMYPLEVVIFPKDSMTEIGTTWEEALEWANLSLEREMVMGSYYVAIIER